MSATVFSGPIITTGNMMDALATSPQITDPVSGPNIDYHGDSFPDPRYWPLPKDALDNPGVIPAHFSTQRIMAINAVPSTLGATGGASNIASPQGTTSGTALTLATGASVGVSLNVPFRVFSSGALATGALLLDLGIETPSTTAASKTVTVANSSIYRVGQPIIITQVGNAAGTTHLLTYVTALASATTITVADAPQATNSTTARIASALPGWANLNGAPAAVYPTFYAPYIAGGAGLYFDSTQALERGVAVTGSLQALGGGFTIAGYDIYGQAQSELITIASGATTGNSRKAYKVIQSITPNFTNTGNTYSVSTIDLFGFPFRNDLWETLEIFYAGVQKTSSTGWTVGDQTSPATTSTGDPRGTYSLQTASQGINRFVVYQTLPFINLGRGSPSNPQFLYGVTPV